MQRMWVQLLNLTKWKVLHLNEKDSKVYIAIADQSKAYGKRATGKDPTDDIQLPKIKSGVTYQLDLNNGQKDSNGAAIDSSYVATSMSGLVVGEDLKQQMHMEILQMWIK